MIISIEIIAITTIANQLLCHSYGAKKPNIYKPQPIKLKSIDKEHLNASFKPIVDRIHNIMPVNKITELFKIILVV